MQKKYDEAIADLRRALEINPNTDGAKEKIQQALKLKAETK